MPGRGLSAQVGGVVVDEQEVIVGLLERLDEQSRARLLAEAFEHSMIAKAVASLAPESVGDLIEVNPAFCRLLGYEREELVGRSSGVLFDDGDRAAVVAGLRSLADDDRRDLVADRQLVRKDGTRVWVTTRAVVTHDAHGARYLVTESVDSTHSHALAASEARAARETGRLRTTIAVQREVTAAAGDRDAVLRIMVERALEVIPAGDAAVVNLLDEQRATLDLAAATGALDAAGRPPLPLTGSLAGLAIRSAATLRCDDTRTDDRVATSVSAAVGVRSLVVAPLLAADGPAGVLTVSSREPDAFDEADEQQLTLLADALTGALRHADAAARNRLLLERATGANRELQAQRAEAQAAFDRLSSSERRFAEVFDHSPVAKMVIGLRGADRGRITLTNPAFSQLLGYTPEQATAMPVQELLAHPSPDFEPALQALADGARTRSVRESVLRHRDGALVYVAGHTSVIADADGPASAVVQLRDITTERAAAKVTEREFQRLRDTLLVQREVTAAAGDRDTAIRVVAERAVHLFPAADGSVVELLDGDTLRYAATAGNLTAALGTRVPVVGSLSGTVLADGAPAYCRDTATDPRVNQAACERLGIAAMLIAPLHAGDDIIGALKVSATRPDVFDDTDEQQLSLLADSLSSALRHADDAARTAALLTAQRQQAALLEQTTEALTARNAELEDANRLKLDLIGMLGHEIGNPLAAILGYTEIFDDDWPTLDDRMRAKVITGISRQARRLDDIVQEVLDMVRIEAGTIHADRAPVRLRDQIELALTGADAEHVPVTGADTDVLVNAGHLQHILTNLISNAAKYGGGATSVDVTATGPAGRVLIHVRDQGPGVPDEFRRRLFERLTRADRDASKVKGTGLGLYIVRSLARANHGDVTHRPNPGGGSDFTVDLEAAAP